MTTTAIVILNYNNYEDTINCIESVEKYNTAPVKYIIVDNGSTREGAAKALGKYLSDKYAGQYLHLSDEDLAQEAPTGTLPYMTYLESKSNDGYAQGNNKGLHVMEGDEEVAYVMILNNDILFVQDIIPSLYEQYQQLQDVAILSPILYKRDMKGIDYNCARLNTTWKAEVMENFFHYLYILIGKRNPYKKKRILIHNEKNLPKMLPIELPSGSCMYIRKELFKKMDYFDPHTFLYYEENILFKKIQQLGLQSYLMTDLKCIHLGATSTSKRPSSFTVRCIIHSVRYYMKHYSGIPTWKYAILCFSNIFYYSSWWLQQKLGIKMKKDDRL